jgi:hypothetical protein
MKIRLIVLLILGVMLALPAALNAQDTSPMSVINTWHEAMNAGDLDTALATLSDDAFIKLVPPPMEGHDGIFSGKEAIRSWWENLQSLNGESTLSDCQVDGEKVTCILRYSDDSLKDLGLDFIDNEFTVIVQDGKIQTYTATMTGESLTRLMAAMPPEALPESGETTFPASAVVLALGSLVILGGLGLALRRRRSR